MTVEANYQLDHLNQVEMVNSFRQRLPWIGGDLQTLRDTFVDERLPEENGEIIHIEIPKLPNGHGRKGALLAILDKPSDVNAVKGLVLMLHGLGGSSRRRGLRRMACALLEAGFAVLRLNLRGADPGRELAGGTYSARCNSDLIPVFKKARELSKVLRGDIINDEKHQELPLLGVGISLGGTILLNACLDESNKNLIDGLICISSPLDLALCSSSIERPRNSIYQYWLLNRLVHQTLLDPFGINQLERKMLTAKNHFQLRKLNSIRAFDAAITALRWGFKDVDDYYYKASPLRLIYKEPFSLPKTFFIQSLDDPWVPSISAEQLFENIHSMKVDSHLKVILTKHGGHNGFHGVEGCWGDKLVVHLVKGLIDYSN